MIKSNGRSTLSNISYVKGKLRGIIQGGHYTSTFLLETIFPMIKELDSRKLYFNDEEMENYAFMKDYEQKLHKMLLEKNG